jgi:hypothetical protein
MNWLSQGSGTSFNTNGISTTTGRRVATVKLVPSSPFAGFSMVS